jgi:hypothetical protein
MNPIAATLLLALLDAPLGLAVRSCRMPRQPLDAREDLAKTRTLSTAICDGAGETLKMSVILICSYPRVTEPRAGVADSY